MLVGVLITLLMPVVVSVTTNGHYMTALFLLLQAGLLLTVVVEIQSDHMVYGYISINSIK